MKKYVVYIGSVYAAKNKLEKNIQELLIPIDRMLLDKKDIRSFKENIIAQINFLNQENKRCSPKKVSWYDRGTDHEDFSLKGAECMSFFLYEIKNEYEVTK